MDFFVEFGEPNFDDFMDLCFYLEELFGIIVERYRPGKGKDPKTRVLANLTKFP